MGKTSISKIILVRRVKAPLATRTPASISLDMRAKQAAKIRELRQVLVNAGFSVLDQQAVALGLSRSTAWALLKGKHKGSGLSATLINRMLTSPKLPPSARAVLIEYVEEKSAGTYGHNKDRLRIFRAQCAER